MSWDAADSAEVSLPCSAHTERNATVDHPVVTQITVTARRTGGAIHPDMKLERKVFATTTAAAAGKFMRHEL